MVAKQLRTVLDLYPRCVVASDYPDEGLSANEGEEQRADLPSRSGGNSHPAHTEARAELRDRETYYTELRFAVHCQSRSIPVPRAALDDEGWTHGASEKSAQDNSARPPHTAEEGGDEGESWDEMIARFDDTWT